MYQPTNRAIGIVQAMVNVPHELPGHQPPRFLGQDEALGLRIELERRTGGHRQVERFVKDHGLVGAVAEPSRSTARGPGRSAGRRGTCEIEMSAVASGISSMVPALQRDFLAAECLDDHDAQAGQGDDDDVEDGDRPRRFPPAGRSPAAPGWPGSAAAPGRGASTIMSCTAPARQTPTTSQTRPGM